MREHRLGPAIVGGALALLIGAVGWFAGDVMTDTRSRVILTERALRDAQAECARSRAEVRLLREELTSERQRVAGLLTASSIQASQIAALEARMARARRWATRVSEGLTLTSTAHAESSPPWLQDAAAGDLAERWPPIPAVDR